MTMKYRSDAAACLLARRISDELIRSTRAGGIGGGASSRDVNAFIATLEAQSRIGADRRAIPALRYAACEALDQFGFDGVIDREGAIFVIDANAEPYVTRYRGVDEFLAAVNEPHPHAKAARVRTITMTGAGTSALGAAAFAWNVSRLLQQAVAAMVPSDGPAGGDAAVLHAMLTEAHNIDRVIGHGSAERVIHRVAGSLSRVRRESLSVATIESAVDAEHRVPLRRLLANAAQAFIHGGSNGDAAGCVLAHGERLPKMRSRRPTPLASLRYMLRPRRAT